jgi:hypothetical protein
MQNFVDNIPNPAGYRRGGDAERFKVEMGTPLEVEVTRSKRQI